MIRATLILVSLIVLLGNSACTPLSKTVAPPPQSVIELSQEQKFLNNRDLRAWLNCEECQEGQLQRVVKLGNDILPQLEEVAFLSTKYLSSNSFSGLEGFQLKYMARQARESYAALVKMNPEFNHKVSENQFVDVQLTGLLHRYQSRAILALLHIGTAEAKQILLEFPTGK